uniref:Uncharacterized protein n=1 Tax=Populus alba TaxID=43335 RepID=A0A4U5M9L5_POPAL|nr:hypothetical protein D5086_0000319200 [Populus alba]
MANIQGAFLLPFVVVAGLLASTHGAKPSRYSMPFNRTSFPKDFTFGAGTAAYQSEGAAYIDGKGPSIWDTFTKQHPEKIWDHSTGNVAIDFYHRYKEDIQLMKKIGLDSFRFSISWSRVLPKGKISGGVNPLGVRFYNNLINELLANGITPFVTLFHWDLPQALDDEYSGFLSSKAVDDYLDYADFCFKTFGDRVKHWCTFNEPYSFSNNGYNGGTFAPGRCSNYVGNCTLGNSGTEPYMVAHNLILGHAAAVKLYREKYQAIQKGKIGITIVSHWFLPKFNTTADRIAVSRALDFMFGWFARPITFGDYPDSMRSLVGNRLPKFTKEQSAMLKGSLDFLGLNYYTANYAESIPLTATGANLSYTDDRRVSQTRIAENASRPLAFALKDSWRIRYHSAHLSYLLKSYPV